MVGIYDFEDYRQYLRVYIKALPKAGHGELRRMAHRLGINSVVVSQVFSGAKNFTLEQATELSEYLGHSDLESDYFFHLVLRDRAGTQRLKQRLSIKLLEIRDKSRDLKERLVVDKKLTEEAQAVFYTSWYYSGIRILSALPAFRTAESISTRLGLPLNTTKRAIDFLIKNGLCIESSEGQITFGPQRTHLGINSPLLPRHHANWRMRGLAKNEINAKDDLFYTGPMALSKAAADQIRKDLVSLIERATNAAVASELTERTACLNIDWFEF